MKKKFQTQKEENLKDVVPILILRFMLFASGCQCRIDFFGFFVLGSFATGLSFVSFEFHTLLSVVYFANYVYVFHL